MSLFLQAFLAGSGDIGVRTPGTCPGADAIAGELRPLLPGRGVVPVKAGEPVPPAAETVEVSATAGGRRLTLRGPAGEALHGAELPPELGCEEAAREVAVWVAAWEFRGEAVPPVRSATAIHDEASRSPAPSSQPSPGAGDRAATAVQRDTPERVPLAIAVGTGLGLAFVGDRPSAGVVGELRVGPFQGVALHVGLAAFSDATLAVGGGHARWSRAWAGVGGIWAARAGRWGFEARGALLGGIFSLAGEGFSVNGRGTQLLLGAESGLRLACDVGATRLWLGPALIVWPGHHTVTLTGTSVSRDLPTLETYLALGVDFSVRP